MKTYTKTTCSILAALFALQATLTAQTQAPEIPANEAVSPPKKLSAHLKLCALLGLKVGSVYEFRLNGNSEFHYWEVSSLGDNGWILAKDSSPSKTWVNLSQIISITPVPGHFNGTRPKKADPRK